jgi:hypothetical protein
MQKHRVGEFFTKKKRQQASPCSIRVRWIRWLRRLVHTYKRRAHKDERRGTFTISAQFPTYLSCIYSHHECSYFYVLWLLCWDEIWWCRCVGMEWRDELARRMSEQLLQHESWMSSLGYRICTFGKIIYEAAGASGDRGGEAHGRRNVQDRRSSTGGSFRRHHGAPRRCERRSDTHYLEHAAHLCSSQGLTRMLTASWSSKVNSKNILVRNGGSVC